MNDVWTKITAVLDNQPEDWSLWCEVFARHGIAGTLQTDNPPTLTGYVAPNDGEKISPLREELLGFGAQEVQIGEIEEEDWAEAWKQFFVPRRVGRNFVVTPSWTDYDAKPGDMVITLDPGQAFGTGDHPTTRGCLELLEKVGAEGKSVADIGCGSGILSVGAGLLGAESIVGVDVESAAVSSARENLARNNVCGEIIEGKGFEPLVESDSYDLVLSNIISAALINLAPVVAGKIKPGGHWIVSGIILNNWPDVQAKAKQCGFVLGEVFEEGDWVAAIYHR